LYNSKKEKKFRNEANLGPNNLWKAVKIAQEKTQADAWVLRHTHFYSHAKKKICNFFLLVAL
jgi:hypothetical protein